MSHITAVFSRRTDLPSFITRLFTSGAKWSHCGIVVDDRVIEALMFGGVVSTPLEEWITRYPSYTTVSIECPRPEAGEDFALAQLGKGYDYLGMLGAPWRSRWQDDGTWYCSELLEACVMAAGRQRFRDETDGLSPNDCWMIF